MNKKWIFAACLAVFIGVLALRFWPRPLSDEAQIARNIEGLTSAANNRRAGDATSYLAPDFFFGAATKDELRAQLAGAFFTYRVVELQVSDVQTEILNAESAKSKGRFVLVLKREFNGPAETQTGSFAAKWRKIEGEWRVDEAQINRQ